MTQGRANVRECCAYEREPQFGVMCEMHSGAARALGKSAAYFALQKNHSEFLHNQIGHISAEVILFVLHPCASFATHQYCECASLKFLLLGSIHLKITNGLPVLLNSALL